MIKINNIILEQNRFPDGSLMMMNFPYNIIRRDHNIVTWQYESDSELFTLLCVTKHIRKITCKQSVLTLQLPFLAHARMDRVKSDNEVFTLKYFCEVINSLNFDTVNVLDPHSYVSEALLNNIVKIDVEQFIERALDDVEGKGIDGGKKYGGTTVIYFPDDGAMKRYKDLTVFTGRTLVYGKKNRDWKTGKILGLSIYNQDGTDLHEFGDKPLSNKVILMIDDIISYGGTLAYSADSLKNLGAAAIYAYASHTENSVLDEEKGTFIKRLNSGVINELFTTNSVFKYENPRITVFEQF